MNLLRLARTLPGLLAVILLGACSQSPSTTSYTSQGEFNIQFRFVSGDLSESQKAIFQDAATRWSQIIVQDLDDLNHLEIPADKCHEGFPAYSGHVDDLLIDVSTFNGEPGGILGSAGPCYYRKGTGLPINGVMILDQADLDRLEQNGQLQSTILHEMGHVLGIGTMWEVHSLLKHNGSSCESATEIHYTGPRGAAQYADMGGSGNVPVEDTGDQGTKCGHWDEASLGQELMTGWLNSNTSNPLSRLTAGSLEDMGYQVNYEATNAYTLSTLAPQSTGEMDRLEEILIRPRGELEAGTGR